MEWFEKAKAAIVNVGKGRGFIVKSIGELSTIVTAASCLTETQAFDAEFFDPMVGIAVIDNETPGDGLEVSEPGSFGTAYYLGLDGEWVKGEYVRHFKYGIGIWWLSDPEKPVARAMLGSPILHHDGRAIGVIAHSWEDETGPRQGQPYLAGHLPGRLLEDLGFKVWDAELAREMLAL